MPYVPELNFPVFPELEEVKRNDNSTVTVKVDWIIRLKEFHIRYEELAKNYRDIKKMYENLYKE